jgi:thiamine monophosphate kinase
MKKIKCLEFEVTNNTSKQVMDWLKKYGNDFYLVFTINNEKVRTNNIIEIKENDCYYMFNEQFISPSITIQKKNQRYKFYFDKVKKVEVFKEVV